MTDFNIIYILGNFLSFLTKAFFYLWWVFILIFGILILKTRRERKWAGEQDYKLLLIQVPKENEKGPVAAEMMFASLYGIFKPISEKIKEGSLQEHISFEIASIDKKIRFYLWTPSHLQDFVEGQIYAQYPDAEINESADYSKIEIENGKKIAASELTLMKEDFFPIRTFPNFEVDPLSGITSTLSKLESENEQIWIQILIKPADPSWTEKALSYVQAVREGKNIGGLSLSFEKILNFIINGLGALIYNFFGPSQPAPPSKVEVKLSPTQESQMKGIEEKASKLPFQVQIRILYIAQESSLVKSRLQAVVGAFKQFTSLNGFVPTTEFYGQEALQIYRARYFGENNFVLNIEELASIFHLPNISVQVPNILWTGFKKGEPPANLPIEITENNQDLCVFAETNFRHIQQRFGIKSDDRRRHIYIIGKTGVGKTTMLENMVASDIKTEKGVAVVDPHGDFVDKVLDLIPPSRINDVVIFDPSDRDWPVAFNPLEQVSADQQQLVVSGLISIFQKIWAYTWGPRLEHILRNTLSALLEYPDSTLLDVNRMFSDKNFRKKVIKKITDVETKRFWTQEFPGYEQNERFKTEAIAPIQNKVGQFLASPTIRNIVGQPTSSIDIRKVMDEGKILLIKLSQGAIGEDNSALLGSMIITKLQLAAMSRVDIPEVERKDFYLYVDEFQNFATPSFAKILSEARKYKLNLILANQYIAQMIDVVRDAIFGNIGTLVAFRVGAQDATFLAREFSPVFNEIDLVNLDKYNIYLKMSIDGVTCPAFSACTLPPITKTENQREKIIKNSRERYAENREFVERKIAERMRIETGEIKLTDVEKIEKNIEEKFKEKQFSEEKIPLEEILEESFVDVMEGYKRLEKRGEKKIEKEQKQDKTEEKIPPSSDKDSRKEIKPGQIIRF